MAEIISGNVSVGQCRIYSLETKNAQGHDILLLHGAKFQAATWKELSKRQDLDLLTILNPIISQWEIVGLIELRNCCLYLTKPGEFWAVDLAQMLIDRLQKDR